jgi:hypothetical protein
MLGTIFCGAEDAVCGFRLSMSRTNKHRLRRVVSHPLDHPNDEDLSLGTPMPGKKRKDGARGIVGKNRTRAAS